jgi:hypothetical protein
LIFLEKILKVSIWGWQLCFSFLDTQFSFQSPFILLLIGEICYFLHKIFIHIYLFSKFHFWLWCSPSFRWLPETWYQHYTVTTLNNNSQQLSALENSYHEVKHTFSCEKSLEIPARNSWESKKIQKV